MRSGVVLELNGGNAVVLDGSGGFRTVSARPEWRTGDVVSLPPRRKKHIWALPAAACLAVALMGGGSYLWFDQTGLVSLDVNPSVELGVNRFDRVVAVTARNDEGEQLLAASDVKGKKADAAVAQLLESGYLSPYLAENGYISLSVQSGDETLYSLVDTAATAVGGNYQVECHQVDEDTVAQAHHYGVTAGKYLALLELQQADPALDISAYTHCGIGEIKAETERCQEAGHDQQPAAPDGGQECEGGNGYGYGYGYGYGHGAGHHGE